MPWLTHLLVGYVTLFTLVLARMSGMMLLAPIYGGAAVPATFRGLLAVTLALLVAPTQTAVAIHPPTHWVDFALLIGGELLVGLVLGLGVLLLFTGLQLAGQIIGQLSGLSLAEVFDPGTNGNLPIVSQFLNVFALAIFVLIGGHRLVVEGLLGSYRALPPGQGPAAEPVLTTIIALAGESFALGIRVAAPTMVALLLATLVVGLVSRSLPQLNALSFGFGLNAAVMLATLAVSLGATALVFEEQLQPTLARVLEALGGR